MEKKVDFITQLAHISDSIEKLELNVKSPTIIFETSNVEFEKIFDLVEKKYGKTQSLPKNTFTIRIGTTDIVFNRNNVD